jgi:hypothetical protein
MESGLSVSSRAEITAKFARAYLKASKADKGQILDQVVQVTGWSRDNARRRLTAAAQPPGPGRQVTNRPRRQRMPKYSYDALKVLQKVLIPVKKVLTCVVSGGLRSCCLRAAARQQIWFGPWWRTGAPADGSRHLLC